MTSYGIFSLANKGVNKWGQQEWTEKYKPSNTNQNWPTAQDQLSVDEKQSL